MGEASYSENAHVTNICGASAAESSAALNTKNMFCHKNIVLMTALILILTLNDPHDA